MKKVVLLSIVLSAVMNVTAQKINPQPKVKTPPTVIKNLLDSFSYMAGYNVATNMREQGITNINAAMMRKGLEDLFNNTPIAIPLELGNKSLQMQLEIFNKKKAVAEKLKADLQKANGVAFLETNKKRKEIITLPSGLQYEIIKAADSVTNKPRLIDTVVVNYIGSLIDGKEFQSSFKRGEPAIFAVTRVMKGWTEILQLMPVGSHWKVYIPNELAYGDNPPQGSNIDPGAVLIFDIFLEGIKPAIATPKE